MFSTLETTWDQSVRKGWSALASLGLEALAVSLLLLLPLYTVEGPRPWILLQRPELPTIFTPHPEEQIIRSHTREGSVTSIRNSHIIAPPSVPGTIPSINESLGPLIPDMTGVDSERGWSRGSGAIFGDNSVQSTAPVQPTTPKVLHVSSWTEGNLLYRVQPVYPLLARQARVQGMVELRAIISKTGRIENLSVLTGPPLLVRAAKDAVLQWRYRPYLLNGEPIEVETEVTVNFVLGGN